ncbi:MAG: single-stranded-DNA-specific exonuclease RecJ [Rhodospirillaceae bacterium]|nr:single-stranded-DNA-specific exonuclease RecJ [Rhodospirillaceae bacterium]
MSDATSTRNLCLGVAQSLQGRAWYSVTADNKVVADLALSLDLPDAVAGILAARGFTPETAQPFLNPRLRDLMPDPSSLAGMDEAVSRLVAAIENEESMVVFGDYDVDGATSSALLIKFFRTLGIELESYIPDRVKEGYGPNAPALLNLRDNGASVVITVDCGITAFKPLSAAAAAGLDVVVIDHHKAEEKLPHAAAVVNPNRLDDTSGQGHLAAVGVTFLVIVGINRALRESGWYERSGKPEPGLMALLDIVSLGTVCDVVPLKGLNRAFINHGLAVMARGQNVGLVALANAAGLKEKPRAFHLGYMLGPRVNAGGRVGESPLGTRLLSCEDPDEAAVLAMRLNDYNADRKDIEAAVLVDAIEQAEKQPEVNAPMVFVSGANWHPGVIGIVASRMRERYDQPACVVACDGGMAKGSGRSVPGVDLGRAVLDARDAGLLFNGGGHAMAAGFTVEEDRLDAFKAFLIEHIEKQIASGGVQPSYVVDAVVTPEGATLDLVQSLSRLEPFGAENDEPKIGVANAMVVKSAVVGSGHIRCIVTGSSGSRLKAIAFNSADSELGYALLNTQGRPIHLAGCLREDNWQGRSDVQLVIDDGAWAA